MKIVLIGLAALLTLLVIAVLVAPSFIDWNSYRGGLAAELERQLGRRVVLDGAVEAQIVPTPRLSMHGARLGNLPGASSPYMAQIGALDVRVAFWPLLSGRIEVTSVVLRAPMIELEVMEDGQRNWVFANPPQTQPSRAPVSPLPIDDVQFDNVVISDGTIVYRDRRSGAEQRVDRVNARFAATSLHGPLRAAGEARYGSTPVRFSVSTGRLDLRGQTATPLNITVELPAQGRSQAARGSGGFAGTVRFAEAGTQFGGQLKLRCDDLAAVAAAFGAEDDLPGLLTQTFNAEGTVEFKDGILNANGFTLQLGETRAQGAANAAFTSDVPQIDIAMSFGRIDLDRWLSLPPREGKPAQEGEEQEFMLPLDVRVALDVSADALTYGGGAMRQAKIAAELADGIVEVQQFSVQLPGGTDASFGGKLLAVDGRGQLQGQAELASDDFRGLLGWLDVDMSDLPAGRLNKLAASGHVLATADALDLGELDVRFDATRMSGAIVAALRDRPALGLNLILDQLNLDSYTPEGVAPVAGEPTKGESLLASLNDFDANLQLRIGQLQTRKTTVRGLTLSGTLVDGVLTMRKLAIANVAGSAASVSGTLEGFDGKLRSNLDFDATAEEPTGLLQLLGIPPLLPAAALKPLTLRGKLSGDAAAHKIDAAVTAGVTTMGLRGDWATPPKGPAKFGFDISLEHPNYVAFTRQLDSGFVPEREAPAQAINLHGRLDGGGQDFRLSSLSGTWGPLTVEGGAVLGFDGAIPRINANLRTGDIDTRYFLSAPEGNRSAKGPERWSSKPIALDLARAVNANLTLAGQTLRHSDWNIGQPNVVLALAAGGLQVKQLTGQMMGGKLTASGRLLPSSRTDAAMVLDYNLRLTGAEIGQALFEAPIDLSSGRFNLAVEGNSLGASEAALLAGMGGKGSVAFEDTVLKGFDLNRVTVRFNAVQNPGELVRLIQSSMSGGSMRVQSLGGDFTLNNGIVAFDNLAIKAPAGSAEVLLAADLPHWRLDATATVHLASPVSAPAFEMQLSGPLDAPKRDFETYALQAFLLEEQAARAPTPPPAPRPPAAAPPPQQRPAQPQRPQPAPAPPVRPDTDTFLRDVLRGLKP